MPDKPTWTPLHCRLHQTCRQRQLLGQQQSVLVAVSGGQDSLCLLKLLCDLQPKWHWQLAIAHCDHRWATDAGIAARVRHLARDWGLPFYLQTAPDLEETEAAAREWRYQALVEIAQRQGFRTIVTGHTLSDRAETLLYNLIRGSGTDGLQALSWQRSLTANLQLIRPLLNVSRQETGQFCQQFQLPVGEDAVNHNLKYARNRIRQEVIPHLQAHFNPQVESAIAQTAEILRADVEYLELQGQELLAAATSNSKAPSLALSRPILRSAPLALQRRAIRRFMQTKLAIAPNFAQIEAVTRLLSAPNRSRTSTFPGGRAAEVQGDWICFVP